MICGDVTDDCELIQAVSGVKILICLQVWKNRKVWEGFVKCCQRTKPQSFLVLLQLPAVQLRDAFGLCPELREPLLNHIQTLTPHQVVTFQLRN